MARAQKAELQVESMKMNRVRPGTNAGFNLLFTLLAAMAIIPVLFVFMISISSEESIRVSGYSFVPQSFSNSAYMFLWNERATILSALWISVLVTVSGTVLGLALTTTMGYVLSRPGFKLKGFYTWVVFIPMIFNGGMVASYVVNANILNMKNTIWALILPLAVSSFNIIVCKTFFRSTIPDSIIESAKIAGASQLRMFGTIVLPISKPVLERLVPVLPVHLQGGAGVPPGTAQQHDEEPGLHRQQPLGGPELAAVPQLHAQRVCAHGHRHCHRHPHCLRVSLLPEILYLRPDHWRGEGISKPCSSFLQGSRNSR